MYDELNKLNLAKSFHKNGELQNAKKLYKEILKVNPNSADANHYLGVFYFNKSKFDKSLDLINKSISLDTNNAKFYVNKGNLLLEMLCYTEAEVCFHKAISLDKHLEDAYIGISILYFKINKINKSKNFILSVLKTNQNNIRALTLLARIYSVENDLINAINLFNKVISLDKTNVEAINDRGVIFQRLGDYENALKDYESVIKTEPDYAICHNNRGVILKSQNKINEAKKSFQKAINIDQNYIEAYKNYFSVTKVFPSDPNIEKINKIFLNNNLSSKNKIWIHLTFVNIESSYKNYHNVFKHLSLANKIKLKSCNFMITKHKEKIEKIRSYFNDKYLPFQVEKNIKVRPIFIIGMPRSGTTLIEQIISSHSKVHGAGELNYLDNLISYGELKFNFEKSKNFNFIRKNYLNKIMKLSNKKYVTDKNPLNFLNVGYISSAIPEAKIIHIHRNPMAVCWSNFFNYFPSKSMEYSFELTSIANYYAEYVSLMKFWENLFPSKIYNIIYENLVEDFEFEVKKLINFLDLGMEEEVNLFYQNQRIIKTASNMQVRKPIYRGSSDEWKNYKLYLKPVMSILDRYKIKY